MNIYFIGVILIKPAELRIFNTFHLFIYFIYTVLIERAIHNSMCSNEFCIISYHLGGAVNSMLDCHSCDPQSKEITFHIMH